MINKTVAWAAAAEAAEKRNDWADAKRCWYRAAEDATDGDLRAQYNKREDAAGLRLQRQALPFQIVPWLRDTRERKAQLFRGRSKILVGDQAEHWGTIHMDSHGPRGNSFWFEQVGKGGALHTDPEMIFGRERTHQISVPGDKIAWRQHRGDEPAPKPVEERLHAQVRELLDTGKLRDPASIKQEQAAEHERYVAMQQQQRNKKKADFRRRARKAIAAGFAAKGETAPVHDDALVDAIVAAMEWAQTQ